MKTGHMDYLVPFNKELDVPYRAKKDLKNKINYIFSHVGVRSKQRRLFLDVSTSGSRSVVNDMACVAIGICKHFVEHPNQYGGAMENIQLQVLSRMWKQVFNHMYKQSRYPTKEVESGEWEYLGVSYRMLSIENGFWEELLRVVMDKDYHQTSDSMVKQRQGVGLREKRYDKPSNPASLLEGGEHFEHLCGLE